MHPSPSPLVLSSPLPHPHLRRASEPSLQAQPRCRAPLVLARDAGSVTGLLASWGHVRDKLSVDTAPPISIPASGEQ